MNKSMHTKEFLEKVQYEGLGYSITDYFGRDIQLHGPMCESLKEAWELAYDGLHDFKELSEKICEAEGWELE